VEDEGARVEVEEGTRGGEGVGGGRRERWRRR